MRGERKTLSAGAEDDLFCLYFELWDIFIFFDGAVWRQLPSNRLNR